MAQKRYKITLSDRTVHEGVLDEATGYIQGRNAAFDPKGGDGYKVEEVKDEAPAKVEKTEPAPKDKA